MNFLTKINYYNNSFRNFCSKTYLSFFSKAGFTLTEISIVLVTIAALVAATMSGVSLVKRTQINNVIKQITQIKTAYNEFSIKYDSSIAGDLSDASLIKNLDSSHVGNGNGVVDDNEALYFWEHLAKSGFLSGNYDGVSRFFPGKGVPAGSINSSGFRVFDASGDENIEEGSLVIEFSSYIAKEDGANDLPVLKPEDAAIIDKKIDDGNPETGWVRAEGSSLGGNCIQSGTYNVANQTTACVLHFIIKSEYKKSENVAITGDCTQIGMIRESMDVNNICPEGYIGKTLETCRINKANNTGSWVVTKKDCKLLTCSGGKNFGDKRILSCLNNMQGNGIEQVCSEYGIWKTIKDNCSYQNTPCGNEGEIKNLQACSIDKKGFVELQCSGGVWVQTANSNCEPMTCNGGLSQVGTPDTNENCPAGYVGFHAKVCAVNGQLMEMYSRCLHNYEATCSAGITPDKIKSCAPNEIGEYVETCIEGNPDYWSVKKNTCQLAKCGDYNIGDARPINDKCANNAKGTMFEVCSFDGTGSFWTKTDYNCVKSCDGARDNAGGAIWPNATSGTSSVQGKCLPFTSATTLPTRNCDVNGNWGEVLGGCMPVSENTPWGDNENLTLWLDADDLVSNSVYSDINCTNQITTDNTAIACWRDKSGNGNNALSSSGSTDPVYRNNNLRKINGRNTTSWSDDILVINSKALPYGDSSYSVTMVINSAQNFNNNFILGSIAGTSLSQNYFSINSSSLPKNNWDNSNAITSSSGALSKNKTYVISFIYDNVALKRYIYVNGSLAASDSNALTIARNSSGGEVYLGGNSDFANKLNGNIAEIIVYNKSLSNLQRNKLESYLIDKWVPELKISDIGLDFWLDASDLSTLYSNSGCTNALSDGDDNVNLGCWKDKHNGGHNFFNSNSGDVPVFFSLDKTKINSGMPSIYFSGNKYLLNDNSAIYGGDNSYSLFAVISPEMAGDTKFLSANGDFSWGINSAGKFFDYWFGSDIVSNSIYKTSRPYVLAYIYDKDGEVLPTAGRAIFINGKIDVTDNASSRSGSQTYSYIGAKNPTSEMFNGTISELKLYRRALQISEIEANNKYLIDKYLSPKNISDLVLWLDAEDNTTIYADNNCTRYIGKSGDKISCWQDKSRNHLNLVTNERIGGSYYYEADIMDGNKLKRSVDFEGNQQLINENNNLDIDKDFTIFAVTRNDNSDSGNDDNPVIFRIGQPANNDSDMDLGITLHHDKPNDKFKLRFKTTDNNVYSNEADGVIVTNKFNIVSFRRGSTLSEGSINGQAPTQNTVDNADINYGTSNAQIELGSAFSDDVVWGYYKGRVAEILVFKRSLSDKEMATINNYLSNKWGVTLQ